MNELAMNTDTEGENQDNENEQTDQNESVDQSTAVAEKASSMGHQSKDDWVNNGGDPFLWQSPEVFLQLKPALSKLKDQGRQIKNLKKENETLTSVYSNQVDNLRAQLNSQRDLAVEESDVTKVNEIQKRIDNLPGVSQPTGQDALSPELQEWNSDPKNDWYRNDEAKQALADRRFSLYKQQNYTDTEAIALMVADVDRLFPDVNANRHNAPPSEGGSKPGNKPSARKVTLKDLTAQEASIWRHRPPNMWKDEAEFLAMVSKTREDENG